MRKKLFGRGISYLVILLVFIILVQVMDQQRDYSIEQNENAHKFGASYMTMNNPYYQVIDESIRTTVEANGDILITRNPALDVDRQIQQIRDLIDEDVEAIFITPVDYEKIIPVIRDAQDKGIKIVFVDTEVYDKTLADSVVVSDNYLAGMQCAQYLMSQKKSAKILILEHKRAKSANDRVQGFVDTLKNHKGYEVVEEIDAEGQLEVAMPMVKDVVSDGLEFDTIFAINDISALGAMAALKESGKLNEISVLGVDGAPEAKAMIKENLMMATSAQDPTQIGELAAEQMYKIIGDEECEKRVLVDVKLVTKNNVEMYGINNW